MSNKNYVVINGRAYHPMTGLPLDDITVDQKISSIKKEPKAIKRGNRNQQIHQNTLQKSTTLNCRHVKKPTAKGLASRREHVRAEVAKHEKVTKFSHTNTEKKEISTTRQRSDRPAETHPIVYRARENNNRQRQSIQQKRIKTSVVDPFSMRRSTPNKHTNKPVVKLKSAEELKNDAIHKALSQQIAPENKRLPKQKSRFSRLISTFSVGLAVMLLGGYLTYISMPNISIKIAAVQAGIDAKYPGYKPDGYAMSGPIRFKDGEVAVKYAYADGSSEYTLTQQKSSWDSNAVKEYFSEKSTQVSTTMVDGLTVYSDGSHAAWVNRGILYQIDGSAELSSEQIQKIATSL